jgi:hypothetical protein
VKQLVMLVTSDGGWVQPGSEEFFAALGDPNPDYDAVAFAVKNLGFIKFVVLDRLVAEIELHPRNVALPALHALEHQLLTSNISLFRIKYLDTEWRSEISASVEHTLTRLNELCTPAVVPTGADRFQTEAMDPSVLFGKGSDETSPATLLMQKWRVSFGNFDTSVLSLAARYQLLHRLTIVGVNPTAPDPVLRFIGNGHRWMGDYQIEGVGNKVTDMPDRDYGAWVSEFYAATAVSGRPRLDRVTAPLRYENETGKPRRLITYDRVLLPWKTASREVFVTSCSTLVTEGATEPDSSRLDSAPPSKSDAKKLVKSS